MTDPKHLEALRETAALAARRAGEVVRMNYEKPGVIREKHGPRDLVTDTDDAAQSVALAVIRENHPGDFILAEEDPAGKPDSNGVWHIPDGVTWTVDPLDGTTNYTTGIPMFCVSVGAAIDGVPVAGAVYDPMRDEMITGAQGLGATLNGTPLKRLPAVRLSHATVAVDWSHGQIRRQRAVSMVQNISVACRTLRALGSAALGLAYVAVGRTQAYFNLGLKPWDTGAAAAIIPEVGGELRRVDGTLWRFGEPGIIAGHPAVLDDIVEVVQRV